MQTQEKGREGEREGEELAEREGALSLSRHGRGEGKGGMQQGVSECAGSCLLSSGLWCVSFGRLSGI